MDRNYKITITFSAISRGYDYLEGSTSFVAFFGGVSCIESPMTLDQNPSKRSSCLILLLVWTEKGKSMTYGNPFKGVIASWDVISILKYVHETTNRSFFIKVDGHPFPVPHPRFSDMYLNAFKSTGQSWKKTRNQGDTWRLKRKYIHFNIMMSRKRSSSNESVFRERSSRGKQAFIFCSIALVAMVVGRASALGPDIPSDYRMVYANVVMRHGQRSRLVKSATAEFGNNDGVAVRDNQGLRGENPPLPARFLEFFFRDVAMLHSTS